MNRNLQDNIWQGDEIQTDKERADITKIMFHNVRNLPLYGSEGLEMFINNQISLNVDIQGFSEHCLDTSKFHVYQAAKDILRKTFQGPATIQFNSSQESTPNNYKPGGTGLLVLGPSASKLEPQGKGGDPMGRWSFVTIRRKNTTPLTIISVYQVCPRPTNLLGNTAYHQQRRVLNMAGRHCHPRKAFIEDLHELLRDLTSSNHDIILGGDFNESLLDRNSGLLQLATAHNLIDPFLHRFPHHKAFGTHQNGNRRIDVVLVTQRILTHIKKIGYAPFDYSISSDHRPLILELSTKEVLGQEHSPLATPASRGVKVKDIQSVQTFISHLYAALDKQGAWSWKENIDNDKLSPPLVEELDSIIGDAEMTAENKCRRRRPEYYSRTIVKQRMEVSLLRNHLHALKAGRNRAPQLQQKMTRLGLTIQLPETQQLTRIALHEAKQRLATTGKDSFEIRQLDLGQMIQAANLVEDGQQRRRLKAIKKAEQGLKTYRILKAMRQQHGTMQRLNRVEIPSSWPQPNQTVQSVAELEDPKTCQEWTTITDPNEVEYYLMLRNRLHFGQAEGTPFTKFPLRNDIDWMASTDQSEQILQGTYVLTTDDTACNDLLAACGKATSLDSIPHELTMDEFKGKFNSWRESTSTSPSGRHLGRYKALFTTIHEQEESDDPTIPCFAARQEAIARLKLSIINYCIRNNYVLQRWKTVLNVMIFKEPGNFKIHRLRVIHIYEADFNALLAIKWRKLLQFADANELINAGQYGGRPGCEAQSLTLLEELKYDLAYLTRRSLFNFDNDATSCYDRILVPLASLVNRKYGLDRRIVALHAKTLQQAEFRLLTATGVSDIHYSHCESFPIHGTGQGSGNSPCIWLFISSTLFDIHQSHAFGVTFCKPDGSSRLNFSMVGFVDDSTGSYNDFHPYSQLTLDQMFTKMQHDAQLWNNLLYATGGKLELAKCSFHVLHFEFKPNGKPIASIDRFENRIHLQDAETHTRIPIPSKRSFESHKTLGHFKSPFGTSHSNLKEVQTKAERLALLIAMSPITRHGALLAYHTVFIPSTKYSLPQSFFPRKKLEQAERDSIQRIIAKCGYNRNTARSLIYAPSTYAGGGFLPWHLLQGEGQVMNFLKHWRTESIVSKTLRIAISWAQWQSGHNISILQDVDTDIPYLECRWIQSLREFLRDIGAGIILDSNEVQSIERTNDIHIMSYALKSGLFTSDELATINYCRLFLHVTTVSELFEPDGTTFIPDLFHCKREAWFNPQTYITLQRRPSEYHIKTKWQRLCRQWTNSSGQIAASIKLGKWTKSGGNLRRRRETYCLPDGTVFHWRYNCYWEYRRSARHLNVFIPCTQTAWLPNQNCTPIAAKPQSGGNITVQLHSIPTLEPPVTFPVPKNFTAYVNKLNPWEQILLHGIHFHFGPYEIMHHIATQATTNKLYLVSDGSHCSDVITYGWVCGSSDGIIFAEHSGFGHGTPTSHRAEAWGALSATLFIQHLYSYTLSNHTTTELVFFSDNSGLIQRLKQRAEYATLYPNTTLLPDWDVVEQINATARRLRPRKITYQWVQSHQDDNSDDLSTEASYNVRADHLAGEQHHVSPRHRSTIPLLPNEKCRFQISGQGIYGHYIQEIRRAYTLPRYFEYMKARHGWSDDTIHEIDWDAFGQAAKNCMISSTQLTKLVHEKLPTNSELAKSNPLATSACHYCGARETFSHLLRCDNPTSQLFREQLETQLKDYFNITGAPPPFSERFLHTITTWICGQNNPSDSLNDLVLHRAQTNIGWHLLVKGFFTIKWRDYYRQEKRKHPVTTTRTDIDFISGIIQILWKVQLEFWERHLQALGHVNNRLSRRSQDKRQECAVRIRLLHEQRSRCLHAHQDQYFHNDVEEFISTATYSQLREYLHLYEPAIQHSIGEAKKISYRSLLTFAGFSRTTSSSSPHPQTSTSPVEPATPRNHRSFLPSTLQGVFQSHKHTRWKASSTMLQSIKTFFTPKHPP